MSPTTAWMSTISPPAPSPCTRAEGDQLGHALRQAAQRRADQEQHDRALEDALAPVEVAELAVQRGDRGLREQVGARRPTRGGRARRGRRTIVGSAVATIVWSSAASSSTSIRPANTTPTRCGAEVEGSAVATAMSDRSRLPGWSGAPRPSGARWKPSRRASGSAGSGRWRARCRPSRGPGRTPGCRHPARARGRAR